MNGIVNAARVLEDVRAVYKLVCEGVMNLADKFFEMERNDAIRGLELYKVWMYGMVWMYAHGWPSPFPLYLRYLVNIVWLSSRRRTLH